MTTQKMALFATCCVWARMRKLPPSPRELTRLLLSSFPDLKDENVDDLAHRICRASHGMKYQCLPSRTWKFQDPRFASEFIAGIWYMTNDEPANEQVFTDHVQSLFPKLDPLDLAVHCGDICRNMMPTIYDWWFPLNAASTPRKSLFRKRLRHGKRVDVERSPRHA